MSKNDKLLQQLAQNPVALSYQQIEKMLLKSGFEKNHVGGSHVKFRHPQYRQNLSIPLHHRDCKPFYKRQAAKAILSLQS